MELKRSFNQLSVSEQDRLVILAQNLIVGAIAKGRYTLRSVSDYIEAKGVDPVAISLALIGLLNDSRILQAEDYELSLG